MSKFLSVFHRVHSEIAPDRAGRAILDTAPDIIAAVSHVKTSVSEGHVCALLNWPESFPRRGQSLLQGKLFEGAQNWNRVGTQLPSGSYGMIRADENIVEACSDICASRSLFLYHDGDMFAVSNSQRALTHYIGRFNYDERVAPWLIATGTTGPSLSYNSHLRLLPPSTVARLRRNDWTLKTQTMPVTFPGGRSDEAQAMDELNDILTRVMGHFNESEAQTIMLGLSGGYDSRAVALYLHRTAPDIRWHSFSGGAPGALDNPGSDAAIGARIAEHFGFNHRFVPNGISDEPMATRLRRFVYCSEGRIDQFRGYMNGMVQFHDMFQAGIRLTLRGDQSFGASYQPKNGDTFGIRRTYSAFLASDIPAFRTRLKDFGWLEQKFPENLSIRSNESIEDFRDRFSQEYYTPYVLGALNETKAAFVDAISPLNCSEVLRFARSLPADLRTGKALFARLIDREGPDIPYARGQESNIIPDAMKDRDYVREIIASLDSPSAVACFGAPFISWLKQDIAMDQNLIFRAWKRGPTKIRSMIRRKRSTVPPLRLQPLRLALRVYMAVTMFDHLTKSAAAPTIRTEGNQA